MITSCGGTTHDLNDVHSTLSSVKFQDISFNHTLTGVHSTRVVLAFLVSDQAERSIFCVGKNDSLVIHG